jgi:tRNA-2-methylthio-N6-dimethylallyladenosine synthase
MNISDAERIASVLESVKYEKTQNINEADLVVVNMCSVRQSAVDRVHWLAEKFKKLRKANPKLKTILTGCVLKNDKKKFEQGFDYLIDIKDIGQLAEIAKRANKFFRGEGNPAERSSRRKNLIGERSGYVPIMTGCNNFCSYCVVPYTRGREVSMPAKDIIQEIKSLINPASPRLRGARKIWLLGQNVNSYKDGKINFPKLLKKVNDIPGDFVLNFTTSHPKDFSDELIETMAKCKKLSMDLNLPIQSGDDEILKKMNRPYTVLQYKNLVKKIRKALPNIRLSTDIIVGFPGETKKQFNNTVKTLKEIGYGVAFINKYSPRQGTEAAKLKDDVTWEEKKRREKILIKLINAR